MLFTFSIIFLLVGLAFYTGQPMHGGTSLAVAAAGGGGTTRGSQLTAEEFKQNVNLRSYFENWYGYAVFESIKTTEEKRFASDAAWVVNGTYGEGAVYINTAKTVECIADNVQTGTSTMLQAKKGSGAYLNPYFGLKTPYPMIIFFKTQQDYEKFAMVGMYTFEFGHGKQVVALPASVIEVLPANYRKSEGMAVFTPIQLRSTINQLISIYQRPISGKFSFTPMGN